MWLAGFYVFFHVWMNLLAELLRFGDRLFYKAWWNAVTFEAYWRLWNLPVHHWIARHVYFPALRKRLSKAAVGFIAFTVSAVFHELVIALPLKSGHMPLAFLAMMAQVPLVAVSAAINARVAGTPFAQLGNYPSGLPSASLDSRPRCCSTTCTAPASFTSDGPGFDAKANSRKDSVLCGSLV